MFRCNLQSKSLITLAFSVLNANLHSPTKRKSDEMLLSRASSGNKYGYLRDIHNQHKSKKQKISNDHPEGRTKISNKFHHYGIDKVIEMLIYSGQAADCIFG